jgi:hypothetical protein
MNEYARKSKPCDVWYHGGYARIIVTHRTASNHDFGISTKIPNIGHICYILFQVVTYMRHSTLEPWLQKGQLKTVSSLSILFFGGGFVFAFLFPIAKTLDIQANKILDKKYMNKIIYYVN